MSPNPANSKGSRAQARLPFFVLACLLCGSAPAEPVATEDQAQQEQRLSQLRERISGLQTRINEARGEHSALSKQLQESEQAIGRLARRLRVLAGRLKRQEARLQNLRGQESQQQRALQTERDVLQQQVRAAYAMGRQEQLKILLNQQDPARVSRVLAYYDYLNRERLRRMQLIRERLDELLQTQQEIAAQREQLASLQAERNAEKLALEQQQSARREVMARLNQQLSDQGRQLAGLKADEQQLQSLLQGLQEALADIPSAPVQRKKFAQLRGKLNWPTRGTLSHLYGEPKIGALRWDGVMISAPEGNEVRTVHAGRVAFADWLRGFGLLLIVDHGDGYMTLYGHNQSLFREAGDWVEAGEPVAGVGSTGGRKSPGVYFAIRRNGKAVNPNKWCQRPRGKKVG